jgi:hypothetical protein
MAGRSPDLPTLCSALIDLANERGGPDNVTVVAARFDGEGLPPPDDGDGAGYHSYHVPESEPAEEPSTTVELHQVPDPPPAAHVVAEPMPTTRWHALLVAAALVALIAAILSALL